MQKILGILIVVSCFVSGTVRADTPALKSINPSALKARIEELTKELLLPGAVVLLRTPQGEYAFGYGTVRVGVIVPPDADTRFRAASNTKTMTAAVIVQLAQEGKLGFDDPISKFVHDVPNGDHINIAQLLEMRSGLYNYTNAPELAESLDRTPEKVWTFEELRAVAFRHPPLFAPGADFDYCNTNYLLLGLAAEEIEGKTLATIFRDRLFGPVGMRNTGLPDPTSATIPEPFSHGYLYGSSSYALVDAPYPADLQAAARAGTLNPNDDTWQNPSAYFAAGGIISTANDLATWIRALVRGNVFNEEYHKRWLQSLQPEDPQKPDGQQYGYGISLISFGKNKIYFHGGEMPGYNSFIGYDPINDLTLIVWSNLTLSLDGNPTANTLMLRVLDEIYTTPPS